MGRVVYLHVYAVLLCAVVCLKAWGQDEGSTLKPGDNLVIRGVPPIPASLAEPVRKYADYTGLPLLGWHPTRREVLLKGLSHVGWISRVSSPGAEPQTEVHLREGGIYDFYPGPRGEYVLYNRDVDGDESFTLYLYDTKSRKSVAITGAKTRNTEPVWSNGGDRLVYSTSPAGGAGVSLAVIDPLRPESNRVLVKSAGNYLKAYDWSPDDRHVAYCEFVAHDASRLLLVDVATGKTRSLAGRGATNEYFDGPEFGRDGKGIFVITNLGSDFRRLAYVELASGQVSYLSGGEWDVEEFALSPDGRRLAYAVNENGASRLYTADAGTGRAKAVDGLAAGVISNLKWGPDSKDLAFNFRSPRTPIDVLSIGVETGLMETWSKSAVTGVDLTALPVPEPISWKSFDGKTIPGYIYRPPARFAGKRPVIIDIHGGPQEQHRPEYLYEDNFVIAELGVAKIFPNVRGSSGYGQKYLDLDNGLRREDAVKDISALLNWVSTQPNLDATRVLLQGESYGGYLALSAAAKYGERVKGVVSESGPVNLVPFLERNEPWRRNVFRGEFGDESNPPVRKFLESISPVSNVRGIKAPIFFSQGKNDPRVTPHDSEDFAKKVGESGIPTWYLLATDEGHGFSKPSNREYRVLSTVLFIERHLFGKQSTNNQ